VKVCIGRNRVKDSLLRFHVVVKINKNKLHLNYYKLVLWLWAMQDDSRRWRTVGYGLRETSYI